MSGAQLLLIVLSVGAGMTAPVQAAINANLRTFLFSAYAASFISFLVGTLGLALLLLVRREGVPFATAFAAAPWWAWSGGLIGAFFVITSYSIHYTKLYD